MYHCGHSVQMTLMRYTDLTAQPRHNNNHVLTRTPIITKPIITICKTQFANVSLFLLNKYLLSIYLLRVDKFFLKLFADIIISTNSIFKMKLNYLLLFQIIY